MLAPPGYDFPSLASEDVFLSSVPQQNPPYAAPPAAIAEEADRCERERVADDDERVALERSKRELRVGLQAQQAVEYM